MSSFVFHGPLLAGNPLFQGRQDEIHRLSQVCVGPLNQYIIVFGGHQSGKTSLIFCMQNQLASQNVLTCWINFQTVHGASVQEAFTFIGDEVIECLNLPPDYPRPRKFEFARWFAHLPIQHRLVLFLEEMGALPLETRQHLANELRDTFHRRLKPQFAALNDLMVVLVGGDELFDLACTEVSTLINVCDEIYLPDLSDQEVVGLMRAALPPDFAKKYDVGKISAKIFEYTQGQPYLTQWVGHLLNEIVIQRETYSEELVDEIVQQVIRLDKGSFFYRLCAAIKDQGLLPVVEILLRDAPIFTRASTNGFFRLELLGVVKEKNNRWVFRNPLTRRALYNWIEQNFSTQNEPPSSTAPTIHAVNYIAGDVNTDGGDWIGRDKIETKVMEDDHYSSARNLVETVPNGYNRQDALQALGLIWEEIKLGTPPDEKRLGRRMVFLEALCAAQWPQIEGLLGVVPGAEGDVLRRVLKNTLLQD